LFQNDSELHNCCKKQWLKRHLKLKHEIRGFAKANHFHFKGSRKYYLRLTPPQMHLKQVLDEVGGSNCAGFDVSRSLVGVDFASRGQQRPPDTNQRLKRFWDQRLVNKALRNTCDFPKLKLN